MKTHREEYLKKKGLDPKKSYGLDDLAKISNIPYKILKEVYKRGEGAWKENPESVRRIDNPRLRGGARSRLMSAERWAYGRVYSFLNNGKTAQTVDRDLKKRVIELLRRRREQNK